MREIDIYKLDPKKREEFHGLWTRPSTEFHGRFINSSEGHFSFIIQQIGQRVVMLFLEIPIVHANGTFDPYATFIAEYIIIRIYELLRSGRRRIWKLKYAKDL